MQGSDLLLAQAHLRTGLTLQAMLPEQDCSPGKFRWLCLEARRRRLGPTTGGSESAPVQSRRRVLTVVRCQEHWRLLKRMYAEVLLQMGDRLASGQTEDDRCLLLGKGHQLDLERESHPVQAEDRLLLGHLEDEAPYHRG